MHRTRGMLVSLVCALGCAAAPVALAQSGAEPAWHSTVTPSFSGTSMVLDTRRQRLVVFGADGGGPRVWTAPVASPSMWQGLETSGDVPPAMTGHFAAYDSVRDEMIVVGSTVPVGLAPACWSLSLVSGVWTDLGAGETPPPATGATVVLDAARRRLISFGGIFQTGMGSVSYVNQMFEFALDGARVWVPLGAVGTPPIGRADLTAILDAKRDRMLIFGGHYPTNSGFQQLTTTDETWQLTLADPPTWTFLPPSGAIPTARHSHAAAWDAAHDRMLVTGGGDASGTALVGLYALDLSAVGAAPWTLLSAGGPLHVSSPSAFAASTGKWYMTGGTNDLQAFDSATVTWATPIPADDTPAIPPAGVSVFDAVRQRAISCFGLLGDADSTGLLFTWSPNDSPAWQLRHPSPPPSGAPGVRAGAGGAIDVVGDQLLVFGGQLTASHTSVLRLPLGSLAAWDTLATLGSPPTPRAYSSMVLDGARHRMLVFGGVRLDSTFHDLDDDVHVLSLDGTPTWSTLGVTGVRPHARWRHIAALDSLGDRLIVVGGQDSVGVLNDIWVLSLSSLTWAPLATSGTPWREFGDARAVEDPLRHRLLLTGTLANPAVPGQLDTYQLTLDANPTWSAVGILGTVPRARAQHTMLYDPANDRMLLGGGGLADWWTLDLGMPLTPEISALGVVPFEALSVTVSWQSDNRTVNHATVYRRLNGGPWSTMREFWADPRFTFRYVDGSVFNYRGHYDYQLGVTTGGVERFYGLQSFDTGGPYPVADPVTFTIRPHTNPSRTSLTIDYWLPANYDARGRIELYDIAGRLVRWQELGNVNGGWHSVDLGAGTHLHPGVYFLRLTQRPSFSVRSRVVVLGD